MQQLILVIHVLISIFIIGLVLIQHGKGADIGAAFGSGASQTLFGSQGSGSFLMKLTGFLGLVFFTTCLTLGYLVGHPTNTLDLAPTNMKAPMSKVSQPMNAPAQSPTTPVSSTTTTAPASDDLNTLPGTHKNAK